MSILKLQAQVLWFLLVSAWCVYNALQDIHRGASDVFAAVWIAAAIVTAGRSAIYANTSAAKAYHNEKSRL